MDAIPLERADIAMRYGAFIEKEAKEATAAQGERIANDSG